MKPSWDDAPDWANYLAMDSDGYWYWYANKPILDWPDQRWTTEKGISGLVEPVHQEDWCKTLDKRP